MEKRRGAHLLPDLEDLLQAKKKRKVSLATFKEGCERLEKIGLASVLSSHTATPTISEDRCIVWLVLKYGWQLVFSVIGLHAELPVSLTQHQRLNMIADLSGGVVSAEQAALIIDFADTACPSLHCALRSK